MVSWTEHSNALPLGNSTFICIIQHNIYSAENEIKIGLEAKLIKTLIVVSVSQDSSECILYLLCE